MHSASSRPDWPMENLSNGEHKESTAHTNGYGLSTDNSHADYIYVDFPASNGDLPEDIVGLACQSKGEEKLNLIDGGLEQSRDDCKGSQVCSQPNNIAEESLDVVVVSTVKISDEEVRPHPIENRQSDSLQDGETIDTDGALHIGNESNADAKETKLTLSIEKQSMNKVGGQIRTLKRVGAKIKKKSKHPGEVSILEGYDIIDYDAAKTTVVPSSILPNRFSFNVVAFKVMQAFQVNESVDDGMEINKEPVVKKQNQKEVSIHTEKTEDGEEIQVLTFKEPQVNVCDQSMSGVTKDDYKDDISSCSSARRTSWSESFSDLEDCQVIRDSICDSGEDASDFPGVEAGDSRIDNAREGLDCNTSSNVNINFAQRGEDVADEIPKAMVNGTTGHGKLINSELNARNVSIEGTTTNDSYSRTSMFIPFGLADGGKKKTFTLDKKSFITDRYPTSFPSYPSDRRSLIALEIYTTERSFVRGLEIIVNVFKLKIENTNALDSKECYSVFSNVDKILSFNINIMREIFVRISDWSDEQCIADVFLEHKDGFGMYAEYCKNYDTGEEIIRQKKKKKDFDQLLQNCSRSSKVMAGQTLSSYLITIVQRIPRYILLLKDLAKRTPDSHPDAQNLKEAVIVMQNKANFINEQLKLSQCQRALEALQTQITGLKEYYIPSRTLVYEGPVCLLTGKKTYQGVLFNDLMVFAFKGDNKQSVVQLVLQLSTVWIEDLGSLDPQTTREDSVGIYTPDRPYRMYVGTVGEKKIWLQNLRAALAAFKIQEDEADDQGGAMRMSCYTYKDGSTYEGSFINAKRDGRGKMTYPNFLVYEGQWEDDERNGLGVEKYCTGENYDGCWKDNRKHGLGTFTYLSGDEISGEWKYGLKNGSVVINYKNGDKFTGMCENDYIEGHGVLTCTNGFYYSGDWSKNLKHGKGELSDLDGTKYVGDFAHDVFHGSGELRYPDGSFYKGRFERGVKHGQGIFTDINGNVYNGDWRNNAKHGNGTMTYDTGDIYDVSLQYARFDQENIPYSQGSSYQGEWDSDVKHGQGVMQFRNGEVYEGEFNNGMICGQGKMVYQDGSEYQGDWRNNLPNGNGIWRKNNGWICSGKWMNGKQNGLCKLQDPLHSYSYEGEWLNGLKQGSGAEKIEGFEYNGLFLSDLRHGCGMEIIPGGSTYNGAWFRGLKHGRGDLKHLNGLVEHQVWKYGHLMESPLLIVPRERTPLKKWL